MDLASTNLIPEFIYIYMESRFTAFQKVGKDTIMQELAELRRKSRSKTAKRKRERGREAVCRTV
jgi:hypothetical protein